MRRPQQGAWTRANNRGLSAEWMDLLPVVNKRYVVMFKESNLIQLVVAAYWRSEREHLLFLRKDGGVTARFRWEDVESWSTVEVGITFGF